MNDEMNKTISNDHLPLEGYNEINLDDSITDDNLTKSEKIRRLKLKEEKERLEAEIARRTSREVEDMEAILHAAANKVKADEMQQGREYDPEERDVVIMREALGFIGDSIKRFSDPNKTSKNDVGRDISELDSHIRGSR